MIVVNYKYNIGDVISDEKRSIKIIDRFYITKQKFKNGKPYNQNEKRYKYQCLKCGNEDTVNEYFLYGKHPIGCNACCTNYKKIIKGVNDISTTAPWMMEYICDKEYCYTNSKYSQKETMMRCPDCGRIYKKSAYLVCANHSLSCVCGDGCSYPNKFMFALLEQTGLDFEREKSFDWSLRRIYDFYIYDNNKNIICEMQGSQHVAKCINNNGRTVEEEIANDYIKEVLANRLNGMDYCI